jgi:GrpB-like predicted nucleotidyltransferase (UPF0157 family)
MTMSQKLQILPYDSHWVVEFKTERDRIAQIMGPLALRIEHNGSTAVPGLAAKPVIDIQLSVKHLQPLSRYGEPLIHLGYLHVPHVDDSFCPLFHRPSEWPHTHHLHVVEAGGPEERRSLAFRDFLREHSEIAWEYAALKRSLAASSDATSAGSREAYAIAKSDFIERVVQVALKEGYPREI